MKYLSSNQTVKEFNQSLKEGMEQGIILVDPGTLSFLKEIYTNLEYYFKFFKEANEIQSRK